MNEDELDGCAVDFNVDPDDDETAALRPLFPDAAASKKWEGVFDA